ncbi:MAG TPA: RagB/SusD family nutrient uptake outer membrane protein [Gemmatimonadales bacterium]
MMRIRQLVSLAAVAVTAAACDSVLSTTPYDRLPADGAISDIETAQAALNGAYAALQSGSVYGLDVPLLGDLPSDNGRWVGTYQFLGELADNRVAADNPEVTDMWAGLYRQIDRDNTILRDVPKLTGVDEEARDQILGSAHFLRALSYHNLVKFWGAVPTPTTPATSPAEAASYTRTPVAQVYDLILSDLDMAAELIPADADDTRRATLDAVTALRARVLLYRAGIAGNAGSAADYQGALDAANAVLDARGVDITKVPYASLFTATGDDSEEDVFRVPFTAAESNSLGSWWLSAGRFEAEPTRDLYDAYEPGDLRRDNVVGPRSATRLEGLKYPTTAGTSHPHVIRLGELVLIRAEVLARQGKLPDAVAAYNQLRVRAGLAPHVLGVDVTTQQEVLDAIFHERRLELALEGDRWPDLVRRGVVVETLGLQDRPGQALFPIPLRDMNTSPLLEQNPGY